MTSAFVTIWSDQVPSSPASEYLQVETDASMSKSDLVKAIHHAYHEHLGWNGRGLPEQESAEIHPDTWHLQTATRMSPDCILGIYTKGSEREVTEVRVYIARFHY
jgi:hypothetical protein